MAAAEGATLRELMDRMGHTSPRAAMIYQHAAQDRDQPIVDAISEQIEAARKLREARGGEMLWHETALSVRESCSVEYETGL